MVAAASRIRARRAPMKSECEGGSKGSMGVARVGSGRDGQAGGLSYGYDVVREQDLRGGPVHGGRRINEAEAGIARRIFREFITGKSPRAIAHGLNADKIAGPRGRLWSDTTIRGH